MSDGPAYITIPFLSRSVFRKLFEMECSYRLILWRWAFDQWIWQFPMDEVETERKIYNAALLDRIRALGFAIQGKMVTPAEDLDMCIGDLIDNDITDLGMTPEEAEAKYVNRMILSSFGIPIVEVRGEMSKRSMYNWVPQFTKANIEHVDPIARRMYYHDGKETEVGRIEVRWLTGTMGQVYFKGHIASLINLLKEFAGISATNVSTRFEEIEKRHNVMPRISLQKELPIELSKIIRAGVGPSVRPKNDPGYALSRGMSKKRKTRKYKKTRSRK